MKNAADTSLSFWRLINRYKIEIPIIQRDYAQGRTTDKAKSVRKQIIQKLMNKLCGGEPLSFDFVYGRVANGVFIPIDGQQRLTTLWLLHVYLIKRCVAQHAESCGKDCPCSKPSILSRFTYATRQSSREFCEAVVANDIFSRISEYSPQDEVGSVEQCVKDQSWFYPDWASDPTVAGMLRTLDEIHTQMAEKGNDVPVFINRLLSDSCPITFQFLDMGEHGLTDDLYLKMNARGLPLTEFENFKASLEKYLKQFQDRAALNAIVAPLKPKYDADKTTLWNDMTDEKKIIWKLEHDWLDVFWDKESPDPDPIKTEQQILSLFRRHFLNVWRLNNEADDDITNALIKPVDGFSFTPFSVYETVLNKCGLELTLAPVFNLFEALATKQLELKTKPAWDVKLWNPLDDTYDGNSKPLATYASRVRFYAVLLCFFVPIESSIVSFDNKYIKWMRVVWNILEDAKINDSKDYQFTLNLIDELGAHWSDILLWLAAHGSGIESTRSKEQVREEGEKARLLVAEPTKWVPLIDKAEGHYILKGSLRFLMHGKGWEQQFERRLKRALSVLGDSAAVSNVLAFRAFVSRFDKWDLFWCGLTYDASSDSWRKILRVSVSNANVVTGWIPPLYKVLDADSDETLRSWLENKSALPNTVSEKSKTAHEVLFQTNVIGNCWKGAELKWKEECYYALIPSHASVGWKKVVLDRRQLDLRKLRDLRIDKWQDQEAIVGPDVWFTCCEKRYIWYRDGKIYALDGSSGGRITDKVYRINENGELM